MTAPRRSGRRPGDSGTREAILAAARESFSSVGLARTTMRGVAKAAGVDPALVSHYFGSKDGLFVAAVELPADPTETVPRLLADGVDGLGERVVRTVVPLWDSVAGGPMLALLRAAASDETAAASLRDLLTRTVFVPLAEAAGAEDVPLSGSLAASQMIGLLVARHVLRIEPLASADVDVFAGAVGATLDRYLSGA